MRFLPLSGIAGSVIFVALAVSLGAEAQAPSAAPQAPAAAPRGTIVAAPPADNPPPARPPAVFAPSGRPRAVPQYRPSIGLHKQVGRAYIPAIPVILDGNRLRPPGGRSAKENLPWRPSP